MAGVQYDISFTGNGADILSQLLSGVQQNTAAVQQLTGVMSAMGSVATSALSGVASSASTASAAVSGGLSPALNTADSAVDNLDSSVDELSESISGDLRPAVDELKPAFDDAADGADNLDDSLEKVGKKTFYLNNIRQALQGITQDLNNAVQPGINLDTQLKQMQAITQVTDAQLDELSESARENAKAFGVEASKAAAGYQVYLAGLGPEIGKVPEALAKMGENATVLSKQMAGDVQAAAGVLTTAVQQYGVSMDDPIKGADTMTVMMNIMSAAAREGSAELPDLKAALEQSGMMAKTANVSFAETNAALEVLSNSGKKGAEGGVALRNVMAILSEGTFLPPKTQEMLQAAGIDVKALADQSKTLAERLAILAPIQNDTAAMTLLFGRENVAAGVALTQNSAAITDLTGKIVGTNAAVEQADIIMESYEERQNRMTAAIQDFGIKIFEASEPFLPFINMGMGALQVMANLGTAMSLFGTLAQSSMIKSIGAAIVQFGTWIGTVVTATAAQMGLNVALSLNPIGLVVIAVAAAVAAIALLINYWDDIWAAIKKFTAWVWDHSPFGFLINVVEEIFPGFKAQMAALWDWVAAKFEALIGWFKKAWDWIKSLFGAGKSAGSDAGKAAVDGFNDALKNTKIDGITVQGAAHNDSPVKDFVRKKRGKSKDDASESGKSISKGSTSGGNRPTTITITIQKLQDQLIVNAGNLKEAAKQAGTDVVNELLMALNSVDQKGGAAYE